MFASDMFRRAVPRAAIGLGIASGLLALSGCSNFIPSSGPRIGGFTRPAAQQVGDPGPVDAPALPYTIVNIDPVIVSSLEADPPVARFSQATQSRAPAEISIGLGDILGITIFESQAGGLFMPSEGGGGGGAGHSGNFVQLPQQQVGRDGMISVPFAGSLRAAGQTTGELERAIAAKLRPLLDTQGGRRW